MPVGGVRSTLTITWSLLQLPTESQAVRTIVCEPSVSVVSMHGFVTRFQVAPESVTVQHTCTPVLFVRKMESGLVITTRGGVKSAHTRTVSQPVFPAVSVAQRLMRFQPSLSTVSLAGWATSSQVQRMVWTESFVRSESAGRVISTSGFLSSSRITRREMEVNLPSAPVPPTMESLTSSVDSTRPSLITAILKVAVVSPAGMVIW